MSRVQYQPFSAHLPPLIACRGSMSIGSMEPYCGVIWDPHRLCFVMVGDSGRVKVEGSWVNNICGKMRENPNWSGHVSNGHVGPFSFFILPFSSFFLPFFFAFIRPIQPLVSMGLPRFLPLIVPVTIAISAGCWEHTLVNSPCQVKIHFLINYRFVIFLKE